MADFNEIYQQLTSGGLALVAPRHLRAYCQVLVGGQDVTDQMLPYLLEVEVSNKQQAISTATITLDDRNGEPHLPDLNEQIAVALGWPDEQAYTTFQGVASDLRSTGQRSEGRKLIIEAQGIDMFGPGKGQVQMEFGDGTQDVKLGDFLQKAAQKAGYQINVDPELAALTRKYWSQSNESFPSLVRRIANEVGGVVQAAGSQFSLTKGDSFMNALGQPMTPIFGYVGTGGNVLGWDIHPQVGRPQWSTVGHTFFDPDKAQWMMQQQQVSGGGPFGQATAAFTGVRPLAGPDIATQQANSDAIASFKQRGYGWTVIDGNPQAVSQAPFFASGYRDGVDGQYRIVDATHIYVHEKGFITRLDIDSPGSLSGVSDSFGGGQ